MRSEPARSRRWNLVLLGLALLPPALVYFPITRSYFVFDDFLNLYQMNDGPLTEYLLQVHGGHILVVRNAVFFLCHALFGLEASLYFWLVLVTHLANVFLLFRVVRLLTGSAALAWFGAVLWGTSPVNQGSLGWYSVYGHVLVGTIVLGVLLRVLRQADAQRPPSWLEWGSWYVALLLACCSFGVAIGIALVFPLVLPLLLPPAARSRQMLAGMGTLLVVVPGLYLLLNYLYVTVAHGSPEVTSYLFSMLKYPRPILAALVDLVASGVASLLGGFCFGGDHRTPGSYALMAVFAVGVGATAVWSPNVARRRLLALVILCVAAYGIIAAGRGPLASSSPVRIGAAAARYHYVAPLLLVMIVSLAVARLAAFRRLAAIGGLAAWIAVSVVCYSRGGFRIDLHPGARAETERTVAAIRAAIAKAPPGEDVYIPNKVFGWVGFAGLSRSEFPGWAAVFVIFFPENVVDGRRVHFIEPDAKVVAAAAAHPERRIASLLVSEGPS